MNLLLSLFVLFFSIKGISHEQTPEQLLKVLTYNVWMVEMPFNMVSHDIDARAEAMPKEIAKTQADVIALQEVWSDKKKQFLSNEFKKQGYPYSFYEDLSTSILLRGLVGNGLLIVSRYPLDIPKQLNERVLGFNEFTRPDEYFARKGVLHVRVLVPNFGAVNVYDTHFGDESYVPDEKRFSIEQEVARQQQGLEAVDFINSTKAQDPVIFMGDLNTYYKTLVNNEFTDQIVPDYSDITCIRVSTKCLGLSDTYKEANGEPNLVPTIDPAKNAYVGAAMFYKSNPPPRTIDYIFVSKTV